MKRILVIDDEPEIRELLKDKLERSGYEVAIASNGSEGVKIFRKNPADLIVTDIIMPEKEGVEVIQEMQSEYPNVKIIAISGGGQHTSMQFCLKLAKSLGAVHTFTKPFRLADIVEVIRNEIGE
ncbi:response regulator [Verrucomicrobiota bacterium]